MASLPLHPYHTHAISAPHTHMHTHRCDTHGTLPLPTVELFYVLCRLILRLVSDQTGHCSPIDKLQIAGRNEHRSEVRKGEGGVTRQRQQQSRSKRPFIEAVREVFAGLLLLCLLPLPRCLVPFHFHSISVPVCLLSWLVALLLLLLLLWIKRPRR